jgi:hypothetical protein
VMNQRMAQNQAEGTGPMATATGRRWRIRWDLRRRHEPRDPPAARAMKGRARRRYGPGLEHRYGSTR